MTPKVQIDALPYWSHAAPISRYPKLDRNDRVDVVVVGGGNTGLTAAYLIARTGRSVAVLERRRLAEVDSGHTSAHLTMVTDKRLTPLADSIGQSHAQAVWDSGLAAIHQIETIVRENEIDCEFAFVDGFLHLPKGTRSDREVDALKDDAFLAEEMGFDAEFMASVPGIGLPGVRFANQARFHPRRYLAGLAHAIEKLGGHIYEHSEPQKFHDHPRRIDVNGCSIECDHVVVATHSPLVGLAGLASATILQTKLALYTSYVISGRIAKGAMRDALFWDTADPYHFLRLDPHRDFDVVIYGGEDHKTGQEPRPEECYARLERSLATLVPDVGITHRWSGQIIATPDGLPLIGRTASHQFVATGFVGNGITLGTIAAMIMADRICGKPNPWTELFDVDRPAIRRGLWDYVKENADYPYYMMRDRFAGAERRPLRSIPRGHGKVLQLDGRKVAAYRDDDGSVSLRSAFCTHMGCVVAWNNVERTWDCPCHGSRFKPDGSVLSGPAEKSLKKLDDG